MPLREFALLFDLQHGTGSQPPHVLSWVPQMGAPFPEPAWRQSLQEAGSEGAPEPSGQQDLLFSVEQTENKGGEG